MKPTMSLLLLAQSLVLAACAVSAPDRSPVPTAASDAVQAGGPAARTPAYRPGVGVIESASVVSLSSSPSAAAGGTAGTPSNATMAYRLKMDDGSTQSVVLAGERFELGDRVEVTSDGRLIRR